MYSYLFERVSLSGACLSLTVLALLGFLFWRLRFWYKEGLKLKESGYMPPPSPKLARIFFKGLCKALVFFTVGPLKVLQAENALFKGRAIIVPNHQLAPDFGIVGESLPFSYRQIGKYGEIASPLLRTLSAWIGVVGVQVDGGKSQDGAGKLVVDAGAAILARSAGSRLLLFPQGKLVWDNVLRSAEYRTGAARILLQARENLPADEPLYALPLAIHYLRDPRHATLLHRFFMALGVKAFRRYSDFEMRVKPDGSKEKVIMSFTQYGAIVAIGKPILAQSLPPDPREAIEIIRQETARLLLLAQEHDCYYPRG